MNYYLQFFIFLDQQIEQNQRTVYSFLDMFGFIGGIFGVLYKVGVVIVGVISKKIFYASVFQTLFHEESKQISKNENLNNKDVKENVKRERFLNEGNRSSIVIPFQVDENRSQSKTSLNEREESKFEINKSFSSSEIDNQVITLQNNQTDQNVRTPFFYSWKDLASEIICLHRCKSKRQALLIKQQRYNAFINSMNTFNSELDCVSVIKSIRELRTMIEFMMDEHYQEKLKLQQSKPINFEKINKSSIKPEDINPTLLERNVYLINRIENTRNRKILVSILVILNYISLHFLYNKI